MSIDGISLNPNDAADLFDSEEKIGNWNGREIRELRDNFQPNFHGVISPKNEIRTPVHHLKGHIKPMMARPPDEVEITVDGGYNEDDGRYVEGKITWTWKDHSDNNESSSGGENTSKDVDPVDRNND